jgi:hypothetical protein
MQYILKYNHSLIKETAPLCNWKYVVLKQGYSIALFSAHNVSIVMFLFAIVCYYGKKCKFSTRLMLNEVR